MPMPVAGRPCLPPVTLILGGARSGKSRYAERLVEGAASRGTYCATAEAGDAEMAERIAAHRARRGPFWRTVEAPLDLASAIAVHAEPERPILVDCLTLWLSNLILAGKQADEEAGALYSSLRRPLARSCSSATKSGWASSPRRRSAGISAMPRAASTRRSQRWPTVWSLSRRACPSC